MTSTIPVNMIDDVPHNKFGCEKTGLMEYAE